MTEQLRTASSPAIGDRVRIARSTTGMRPDQIAEGMGTVVATDQQQWLVQHDTGGTGRYRAGELTVITREIATTAHELTPTEQRLAELERGQGQIASSITGLRYTVARHDEQLRSLSPPEDPDDEPPAADVPQGDPLELARAWRELSAEDQELVHGELLGLPLSDVASLHSQAAADALGAVEPLAAEVERLRDRELLVARQLGASFGRDSGSLEVMASHACARYDACRYELQEARATAWRLTRQLAELAGEDPDGEHEADDLIEKIEQQLADTFRERTIATQQRDSLIAEVARLKPWARLAQKFLERLGSLKGLATAQGATSDPTEGSE